MNNFEDFGATFFQCHIYPSDCTIYQICISQCYETGKTSIWKNLIILLCRFFFSEAPHFHPRLYFSESQTSPQPFHQTVTTANTNFCQDLHILSFFGSDLRSPYPTNIDTSHLIFFVLTYPPILF